MFDGKFFATVCVLMFVGAGVLADDEVAADETLETRVYPVADLVFTPPDYPYQGNGAALRHAMGEAARAGGFTGGSGGMGGGMGGGFGGGGGGGFGGGGQFYVQDADGEAQPAAPTQVHPPNLTSAGRALDDLIEVITITVAPTSWDEVGGTAWIVPFRGQLVVSTMQEAHEQIEELLAALRKEGGQQTVTVRAHWLPLTEEEYRELTADMPATSPTQVNREKLLELSAKPGADQGEITCFDGQLVHIVSGKFRNTVTGVIPVVGQLDEEASVESAVAAAEPASSRAPDLAAQLPATIFAQVAAQDAAVLPAAQLAQVATGVAQQPVGYQPVITVQHTGVLLELTPRTVPQDRTVMLDLRSVVTSGRDETDEQVEFAGVTRLNPAATLSQQLSTTIKAPLDTPVLAGGMTFEPFASSSESAGTRLYLVIECRVAAAAP